MHIAGSGRVVFVAQWITALFLPVFVFIGRGFVGAQLGWLSVLGIVYGLILVVLLYIPPILTLFDREVRRARATRFAYDLASALLWLALIVTGLTIPDAGDGGELPTALTAWFGVSSATSTVIFGVAGTIVGLAYVATFVLAITGIVRGRGRSAAPTVA